MASEESTETLSIKGVLIDLDGTLIDHSEALYLCYKHITTTLGYPVPTKEQVKRAVGGTMPVTMRHFIREEDMDKGIKIWRNHFDTIYLDTVVFMPGAMHLLETLKSRGIAAAVFTNKIGKHARGLCDELGATPYLKFILGAEDTPYRKPEVEFSTHALEHLETKASETVMIGDSPYDIQAAHCIGMTSFTVPTGSHTRDELEEARSDHVFEGLAEIADYIAERTPASKS